MKPMFENNDEALVEESVRLYKEQVHRGTNGDLEDILYKVIDYLKTQVQEKHIEDRKEYKDLVAKTMKAMDNWRAEYNNPNIDTSWSNTVGLIELMHDTILHLKSKLENKVHN
jgi:hypothetical protein